MSFNNKNLTQGGQVAFYWVRMYLQINKIIFKYLFIFFWIFGAFVFLIFNAKRFLALKMGYYYFVAKLSSSLGDKGSIAINLGNQSFRAKTSELTNNNEFIKAGQYIIDQLYLAGWVSFVFVIIISFFIYYYLGKKGSNQSLDDYVSGRKFEINSKKVAKQLIKEGIASDISISNLPIIKDSEIQNFLFHGTVGTGKSTLINELISQVKLRGLINKGDKIIIYDRGNSFTPKFYDDKKDYILNPLDDRCVHWSLWDECITKPDFDMFASSFIPEQGNDPFWYNAPRTVLSSIGYEMKNKEPTYKDFLYKMLVASTPELKELLKDTESENFVSGKAEKTTESIRNILTTYGKAFVYMQGIENEKRKKFNIKKWMEDENDHGVLWLTSNGSQHDSIKPLITAWLSIAINSLFSLGEDKNRRVWFFLDEIYSLNKLPILSSMLAEGRKFGSCFVLGLQNFSQLEDLYGQKGATGLLDLINTRYFLRSPSYSIAKKVSDEIGHARYKIFNEQYAYGTAEVRDGVSFSKKEEEKIIVSADDIMQLPNLQSYVTYPAQVPVTLLKIKYTTYPDRCAGFIPRIIDTRIVEKTIDSIALLKKNMKQNQVNTNTNNSGGDEIPIFENQNRSNESSHANTQIENIVKANTEVSNREEININEQPQHDEYSL